MRISASGSDSWGKSPMIRQPPINRLIDKTLALDESLGGSFVGLLAARQNIHMDCGILGSSDLDQASLLAARLQTDFLLPLIYPVVRDGKLKAKFLQKRLDKRARESGDYVKLHFAQWQA